MSEYGRGEQLADAAAITFFSVIFFIITWVAFGLDVLHGGG
jgi:hypothetical protein